MKTTSVIIILFLCIIQSKSYTQEATTSNIDTLLFKVEGNCSMCKERIEDAASIKGVKRAEWNTETKMIEIIYRKDKVEIQEVHKAIAEVGHATEKLEANEKAYEKLPACCSYKTVKHHE